VIFALLLILHILSALTLILVVLLQVGKGQSIGAAFGGASSSQTFFGSRGPATFLSHMTTGAAALFMLTSLGLTYQYSSSRQSSGLPVQTAPPVTETAPTPALPMPEPTTPMSPTTESSGPTPPAVAPAPETSQTPSPTDTPRSEDQQKQ
jgi:preprotein translocase subunit SecG